MSFIDFTKYPVKRYQLRQSTFCQICIYYQSKIAFFHSPYIIPSSQQPFANQTKPNQTNRPFPFNLYFKSTVPTNVPFKFTVPTTVPFFWFLASSDSMMLELVLKTSTAVNLFQRLNSLFICVERKKEEISTFVNFVLKTRSKTRR